MKYLAISFVILCLIMLFACTGKKESQRSPNITAVYIDYDITDPLLAMPDNNSIESQFSELKADNSTGAIFHTALLTDVPYAPETQVEIKPQNFLLSNPGQRKQAVDDFFNQVGQAVTQLRNTPVGIGHSDLFGPIARSANQLSQLPARNKELIIYSNLYQNDNSFSVYRKSDLALLSEHPDEVKKILLSEQPLSNLSGMAIKITYQPRDYNDGILFGQMAAIYQQIFLQAGASSVTISANLLNQ